MQISIITEDMTTQDAAAVIVLLNTVSPGALQAAMTAIGNPAMLAATHVMLPARAIDAMEPDPDPTEAFGAAPDPTAAFGAPDPLDGAPPAPPSAPAVGGATPEVDKAGYPWDARIHATTAAGGGTINKTDGLWRAKKGVSADEVAAVQAELRAGHPAPPPPPPPPVESVGGEPLPDTVAPPATAPATPPGTSESAPPAPVDSPAPPASSPAPSPPTAPRPIDLFQALMKKVSPAQNAGLLTVVDINGMCAAVGIKQLGDLLTQPQHIPLIEAQVDALIAAASGA